MLNLEKVLRKHCPKEPSPRQEDCLMATSSVDEILLTVPLFSITPYKGNKHIFVSALKRRLPLNKFKTTHKLQYLNLVPRSPTVRSKYEIISIHYEKSDRFP